MARTIRDFKVEVQGWDDPPGDLLAAFFVDKQFVLEEIEDAAIETDGVEIDDAFLNRIIEEISVSELLWEQVHDLVCDLVMSAIQEKLEPVAS